MADCAFTDMSDSSFDATKTIRAPTLERHKILYACPSNQTQRILGVAETSFSLLEGCDFSMHLSLHQSHHSSIPSPIAQAGSNPLLIHQFILAFLF